MSLLLKLSGSRRESTVVEQGEFDPETQLWSTVRDAGSFEDALKVLASDAYQRDFTLFGYTV